ncbi:M48 family metallopeptidase [Candidatus Nomurabacteria bacterium]|nr:M48 family metallopeptidase [Candidatus Nomurabacteria bacterium]
MEVKTLLIGQQEYQFILKRRKFAKYIRLSLDLDGSLQVTAGKSYPFFLIKKFLLSRKDWLEKNIEALEKKESIFKEKHSAAEIKKYKQQTRKLVEERLKYFNQFYNFEYQRVAIRNQKSRWGSCSSQKNLNFNYRLCLLPAELSDCVVVHELCHLREMNHSVRFWALVAKTIPDYKIWEKKLKEV